VLDEATAALACLDAEALGELEARALRLQALLSSSVRLTTPEIAARHRVFAGVVKATGENLGILDRRGSLGAYGRMRNPWAH
jgi:hypothetical protein